MIVFVTKPVLVAGLHFSLPVWPSVSPAGTSASAYVNSFSVVLSAARLRVGMLAPGAMFRPEMAPSTKMRFNVAFCQSDETSRDLEALLNEQALLPT